jgi:hypothetical protein
VAWSFSGWQGSWFWLSMTADRPHRLASDPMACAVYDNTITPTGSTATAGYGSGAFAAGELVSPPGWPAGGRPCPLSVAEAAGFGLGLAGGPVVSAGPVSMTPYGSMIYDTLDDALSRRLALCFHYFGGPVPVNRGQLTIAWNAAGGVAIMEVPVTATPAGP